MGSARLLIGDDIKQHIFTLVKKLIGAGKMIRKERDKNSGFTMSTVAEKANTSLAISTTVGTYENRRTN